MIINRNPASEKGHKTAPRELDPKNLPPGHSIFGGQGGKTLIAYLGEVYGGDGKRLDADISKLRADEAVGQHQIPDLQKELAKHRKTVEVVQTKKCSQCSEDLPMPARFCFSCGTAQQALWMPGDGDSTSEAIRKLIDPANPLASLQALTAEPVVVKAETPQQIHERIMAKQARELGKESLDPGMTVLPPKSWTGDIGSEAYGTAVVETQVGTPKGKGVSLARKG